MRSIARSAATWALVVCMIALGLVVADRHSGRSEFVRLAAEVEHEGARTALGQAPVSVSPVLREQYRLVDITQPESLSERQLDHIMGLRASYGISTDRSFVESLYADPAGHQAMRSDLMMFGNLLVVPAELDSLDRRAALEWEAQGASAVVSSLLRETYAGSFVDNDAYVVQCAGCTPADVEQTLKSSELPPLIRASLQVRQVTSTSGDLDQLFSEVIGYLAELDARTNGVGVFPVANRVEVHIGPNSTPGVRELLADRFRGRPVVAVDDEGNRHDEVNKDEYLIYGLVEGGQAIRTAESTDAYDCTSGFSVQSQYGPFMLTAGHCDGYTWEQGVVGYLDWATLGTVSAINYGGYFDAEIISTYGYRTTQPRFHRTSSDYFAPVTFLPGNFNDLVNLTVCQSGATTTGISGNANPSDRCGTIQTISYDLDGGFSGFTNAFIYALYWGDSGDSGSAVVWSTQYGYGAVAIHQGGDESPYCCSTASRMDLILYIWGLQLQPY